MNEALSIVIIGVKRRAVFLGDAAGLFIYSGTRHLYGRESMIRHTVLKPRRCENLLARLLLIGGISVASMAMLSGSDALAQMPDGPPIPPQSY